MFENVFIYTSVGFETLFWDLECMSNVCVGLVGLMRAFPSGSLVIWLRFSLNATEQICAYTLGAHLGPQSLIIIHVCCMIFE